MQVKMERFASGARRTGVLHGPQVSATLLSKLVPHHVCFAAFAAAAAELNEYGAHGEAMAVATAGEGLVWAGVAASSA